MTNKKKCIFAIALVVWVLGAVYLGFKSLDEIQSGKKPFSGIDGTLSLKNIMMPSLKMREQE